MSDEYTRREFLGAAAAGLASAGLVAKGLGQVVAAGPAADPPDTRIRKVFLAKPVPSWPKPDIDLKDEMRRIDAELERLSDQLRGIRFEGGELYRTPSEVPTTAEGLGRPDGLLVFNLTSGVTGMLEVLAASGLPTVLYSQPFSGHDWSRVPALRKAGHRIICLATSDYGEIAGACRLIRTIRRLKETRILYVSNGPYGEKQAAAIRERLGPTVVSVSPDRLNAAYRAVPESDAKAEAREWIDNAAKVVEPSEQEIADSGRLYLALRRIMEEEKAQAVTINCLGLFAQKLLPAYPCLAFCKLNNIGLAGVCEGDMDSTLTQLIFTYAFGVPGFVSDPVIDTATNTVVHAHCVSATRMDGPDSPPAPYVIRSHLEDNKGASLQVRMRVGQVITMAKLVDLETMLISTGTIMDNPDLDRGCRTKITTRVADARRLLNEYGHGLHRVIFYGDRVNAIRHLANLMKLNVVQEM